MFKALLTIFLTVSLCGCTIVSDDRNEVQKAVSECFDEGFLLGLYCIEKGNTVQQCKEILKKVQKERGE